MVTSRKALQFVVKSLTDIVPFEPAYCLKVSNSQDCNSTVIASHDLQVHINHPPHRLAKCRNLVADYITLIKIRLRELKVCACMRVCVCV